MKRLKFLFYDFILCSILNDSDVHLTDKQKSQIEIMRIFSVNYDYLKKKGIL